MFRISVGVCALFLLACCAVLIAPRQSASASQVSPSPFVVTYYACVNNSTGAIRIVSKTTTCKSTEHKINWNEVGPKGARGPQGPEGPAGPQGPPGMSLGYSTSAVVNSAINANYTGVLVNQTAAVATAGTYYLSASVLLVMASGDTAGDYCYMTTADQFPTTHMYAGTQFTSGYSTLSMTDVFSMAAGDSAEVWCYDGSGGTLTSSVYDSTLTATLINSANNDVKPSRHQHKLPPGVVKK